jgi:hypothetical protein
MLLKKLNQKWNKLTVFFDKPAWKNRLLFYISIFAIIFLAFIFIFSLFELTFPEFSIINNTAYTQYNTTQLSDMGFFDNERYLLSALVQSLAATIALVITLSLVAVQLAAQSYSARVIEVYKRNPDMWILLSIYIITIFYGLGLIKVIGLGVLSDHMEGAIFVAYFLGLFAFVCLVPYMLKTLDLLKPSTVIKLLAEEITKGKILEALEEDGEIIEKDPVQPIIDMINAALERNDYETVRNGHRAINKSTIRIFENSLFEGEEENKLSFHILRHVEKHGIQAAKRENEDSTLSAIKSLSEMGSKAVELKLERGAWIAVDSLGEVGNRAILQELEGASWIAAQELGDIGFKAAEQKFESVVEKSADLLGIMGIQAVEHQLETTSEFSAVVLGNIGFKAVEQKLERSTRLTIDSLESIGIKAVEEELKKTAGSAVKALENIGTLITENGLGNTGEMTVYSLENIGTKATERELETILWITVIALGKIGVAAANNKHEKMTNEAENGLNRLWTEAEENLTDSRPEIFIKELDGIDKAREKNKS